MRNLRQGLSQLTCRQKLAVGAMVVLIVLTWLAVCLVLAGYLAP